MAKPKSRVRAPADGQAASPAPWAEPVADIFAELAAGPKGLAAKEAASRKERFGPNQLASTPKRSEIVRFPISLPWARLPAMTFLSRKARRCSRAWRYWRG